MSSYIVVLDSRIKYSTEKYADICEELRTYDAYAKVQSTVWMITTDDVIDEIRDNLAGYLSKYDNLLVLELNGTAAWVGISEQLSEWLHEVLE